MYKFGSILLLLWLTLFFACANQNTEEIELVATINEDAAKVTNVECTGQANNYTLSVTIESPDTGCDQYANWWEVVTPNGELIYRRILGHSHVDEQPFTRSGGPVAIEPNDTIIVRAHMNNLGYGTQVFSGIVLDDGLRLDSISKDFALALETQEPLPGDCPF